MNIAHIVEGLLFVRILGWFEEVLFWKMTYFGLGFWPSAKILRS